MSKKNKVSVAVSGAIVATVVAAVGYCIVRRVADWKRIKNEIEAIPWDIEVWEAYRQRSR